MTRFDGATRRGGKTYFRPMGDADPSASFPVEGDFENPGAKYAAKCYSAATLKNYERLSGYYEAWCAQRGLASYSDSSRPAQAYLVQLDGRGGYVRVVKNAICWAYVRAGFRNPARDASLLQVVEAAARRRTRSIEPAVPVQTIIAVLAMLDPDIPTDARTACLILFGYASGLRIGVLLQADRARTSIDADGVLLDLRYGTHHVSVGSSPATCPAWWLARWLRHVGTAPGPVFVSANPRGGWNTDAIDKKIAYKAIERAWIRAKIDGPAPSFRTLRRSFAGASVRVASKVVVAHQLRVRTMKAMRVHMHLPGIGADDHWGKSHGRGGKRAGGR